MCMVDGHDDRGHGRPAVCLQHIDSCLSLHGEMHDLQKAPPG